MGLWKRLSGESETELLRRQIEEQRLLYEANIVRLENDYDDRVKSLRERYEDEVKYLRERVKTVEQEQERLTLFLHPNLNRVSTRAEIAAEETNDKNREPELPSTTSFQRMAVELQRKDREGREEAKRQFELRKLKEEEEKKKQVEEAQPQTAA